MFSKLYVMSQYNNNFHISCFNLQPTEQVRLLSFSCFPLIWPLPHRRYCNTVNLRWVSEEMKVKEGHKSNGGHWLSSTSRKCNICHDLPKWLSSPCFLRTLKGPFVLCRLLALQSDAPSARCASCTLRPLMVHHEPDRCTSVSSSTTRCYASH